MCLHDSVFCLTTTSRVFDTKTRVSSVCKMLHFVSEPVTNGFDTQHETLLIKCFFFHWEMFWSLILHLNTANCYYALKKLHKCLGIKCKSLCSQKKGGCTFCLWDIRVEVAKKSNNPIEPRCRAEIRRVKHVPIVQLRPDKYQLNEHKQVICILAPCVCV